jgi:hypothetical protein
MFTLGIYTYLLLWIVYLINVSCVFAELFLKTNKEVNDVTSYSLKIRILVLVIFGFALVIIKLPSSLL